MLGVECNRIQHQLDIRAAELHENGKKFCKVWQAKAKYSLASMRLEWQTANRAAAAEVKRLNIEAAKNNDKDLINALREYVGEEVFMRIAEGARS